MLSTDGCLITVDSIGCQKNIAGFIVDMGADYILVVKGNQKFLHVDVRDAFVVEDMDWICKGAVWKGMRVPRIIY